MEKNRIYEPPVEQFKRSNMDDVLNACARENAQDGILRHPYTMVQENNYQEVEVTEESRRISAEMLV